MKSEHAADAQARDARIRDAGEPSRTGARASAARAACAGLALCLATFSVACARDDWRDARRDSAGIAPLAAEHEEAVVQVYSAAVYGWRGMLADHSWIAVKAAGADTYRRYEVLGWRLRRGQPVVSARDGVPDHYWYGSEPKLHVDLRGAQAEALIPRIDAASACYPWADQYRLWPGPNSNSYIQWIGLAVPELDLSLPWRALGKNWMHDNFDARRLTC
ncbi:MAG TPA: DUF3750 domain-containing protein [Pseudomonadales bacterium]|nr:DUF3750 domain-containing protein [Pseudomonadales bacterium]